MVPIILAVAFLIFICGGVGCAIAYMNQFHKNRAVQTRSLQSQLEHNDSLRALELAKAWEKALKADVQPQLEQAKVSHIDDAIVEPILTIEDVMAAGANAEIVAKYREQQLRQARRMG